MSTLLSRSLVAAMAATGVAAFANPALGPTYPDFLQCIRSPPSFSCENKTEVNACCLPTQGLVLATQFWDTYSGREEHGQYLPMQSWTIHGLWPDNCDGSYEQYCDFSRQLDPEPSPSVVNGVPVPAYTGPPIDVYIKDFGRHDLLEYINKYWVGHNAPSWTLWAHEYSKHATCFSTFDTSCYGRYKEHEDLINYLDTAVAAYKQYPTYKWLQKAGIVPSNTTTYAKTSIVNALTKASGAVPHIACTADGSLNEVWYYSHSLGAPQFGLYKPLNTTFGNDKSCPDLVHYFKRAPGSER